MHIRFPITDLIQEWMPNYLILALMIKVNSLGSRFLPFKVVLLLSLYMGMYVYPMSKILFLHLSIWISIISDGLLYYQTFMELL